MAAAEYEVEVDDQISGFFSRWASDPRFCAAVMALPADVDPFESETVSGVVIIRPSAAIRAIAERLDG